MPEKRPTHIRLQNWKKTIAGAVVIFMNLCAFAQTPSFQDYNFFDNRTGLPSHITRKTRIDQNGTAWIATDAGISIIPENPDIHQSIIKRVGSVPVWDIYFHKNLIYIGTLDSQILVFNQNSGKFSRKIKFEKFRRFRELNGKLFALGAKGIAEISLKKPKWWLLTQNTPSKTTVLDICYWKNTYRVFQYGKGSVLYSKNGKDWYKDESIVANEIKKSGQIAICAKTINDQLYLGMESNQYKIFYNWNNCDSVVYAQRPEKSYAIWDIESDEDKVYFALGNHYNFDEGSVIVHHLNNKTTATVGELPVFPFIWGITVDTINNGLWLNSIISGASFIPDLGKRISTPIQFNGFLAEKNHILGWTKNQLFIKNQNIWIKHEFPVNIKNCIYIDDKNIFIHCEKGLYHLNESTISLISPNHFQFCELVGDYLYLTEYFQHTNALNVKNLTFTANIHKELRSIITLKPIQNKVLAQTENNGFFLIHDTKVKSVTLDHKKPKSKNNFFFSGNLLISENGKEFIFYKYNDLEANYSSLNKINMANLFPNQKIDWIQTNMHGIWIFTNSTLIQLAFKDPKFGLQLVGQYYLGNRANEKHKVHLTDNGCFILTGNSIDFLPFTDQNQCSNKGGISVNLDNYKFFSSSITGRVWQGSNFQLVLKTPKFIQYQDGYVQMELIDEKGNLIRQCIYPNNTPIWFNDLNAGVYQIKLFNGNNQKNIIFRVNKPLFQVPAFWFLLFLGIGLLVFVLVFNQKERFKLSEKLLSMELATLKNNMNPHFIFNTMNLIQSLIVRANVKQALKATSELAKLNRLFLETSNKDFVQLSEEIEYAQKYVGLEQMRFESDQLFHFQIHKDESLETKSWYVPPLILQPLLENAIKHGALMSNTSTNITLNLDLASPHLLLITVRNEINRKRKPKPGTQIGLKLVRERLNLLNRKYPNLFQFNLNIETSPYFFTVFISIKRLDQQWIYE
jgi:hypothetical protein